MTIAPVAPQGGLSQMEAPVGAVAFCPSCGVRSDGGDHFCLSCGRRLGYLGDLEGHVTPARRNRAVLPRVGTVLPGPDRPRRRLSRVSAAAGILILLIAVAGALVLMIGNHGPTLEQQPAGVVVLFGILAWAGVVVIALALCATAAAGDRTMVDERAELLRAGRERRRVASLISTRSM